MQVIVDNLNELVSIGSDEELTLETPAFQIFLGGNPNPNPGPLYKLV